MSDVQSTFRPKRFHMTQDEFMPLVDEEGARHYQRYRDIRAMGYEPTQEMADLLMSGKYRASTFDLLESEFPNPEDSDYFTHVGDGATNIFGGQSLAHGFEMAGVTDFNPNMAQPINLSTLRGLDTGSYSKEIGMKRGTLADALAVRREKSSQLGGGFAGYGQRGAAQDVAQQKFQAGAEAVYEDINKQRAGILDQLYSQLGDYESIIGGMDE